MRRSLARPSIRVLIVDSNRMSAQLLGEALRRDRFDVVYDGPSISEAVAAAGHAQVALVSVSSSDQANACDMARQLRSVPHPPRIIFMIEDPQPAIVVEGFRLGIRGIFSRSTSLRTLKKCIQTVHEGQLWVGNAELHCLLDELSAPQRLRLVDARGTELLSKREEDVVRCACEGLTNREIAQELGLSENTVKNYLFRIFDKLGISNRVELILYAVTNLAARQAGPERVHADGDLGLLQLCRQAAEKRSMPEFLLAEIYREGRGVPADLTTACMWFLVAEAISAAAHTNCRAALQELAKQLSPQHMTDAKRRASAWLSGKAMNENKNELADPAPQAA